MSLIHPANFSLINTPSFVMCYPHHFGTDHLNNKWMEDMPAEARQVDMSRAERQFFCLYGYLASEGLVYLLPNNPEYPNQDGVFTANLGIVIPSAPEPTVIVSNYTVESRQKETPVGVDFFKSLGFKVEFPEFKFEGEAELKHLHTNVYLGGYGIRTQPEFYDWLAEKYDLEIVQLEETDKYLYHLDTTVFPLTKSQTIICTEMYDKSEIKEIEKHTEIIDVSVDDCYSGLTNSVRLHNIILNASNINSLKQGTEDYRYERDKNNKLCDIAANHGFEVKFIDLSEYMKAGGLLSCMVMHLNRVSYESELL